MVNNLDDLILEKLKGASGPVPGPLLAAELGISRVALWKRIQGLQNRGCRILSSHRGYCLEAEDLWQAPEEGGNLPLVYFRETESTMDDAWRLAQEGACHGTLVSAETQRQGRGQLGRTWVSPPGGLYATLILRSPLPQTWSGALVMEAAHTVLTLLDEAGFGELEFRWPNDLYLGQKKVGGILAESAGSAGCSRFFTLGLGLNLRTPDLDDRPAASLEDLGPAIPRRRNLARAFQKHMAAWASAPLCDPGRWNTRLLRRSLPLKALTWQEEIRHLDPGSLGADGSLQGRHNQGSLGFGETKKVWGSEEPLPLKLDR